MHDTSKNTLAYYVTWSISNCANMWWINEICDSHSLSDSIQLVILPKVQFSSGQSIEWCGNLSFSQTHTHKSLSTKQWLVLRLTWGLFLSHCRGRVTLRSWCSLYAWPVPPSIAGLSNRMSKTLWMWGISHHGWVIVSPRWKSLNCGLCCTQPCSTHNHEIWQKQKTSRIQWECFCIAQLVKSSFHI